MTIVRNVFAIAAGLLLAATNSSLAAPAPAKAPGKCALRELGSLPITVTPDGLLTVPVTMGGAKRHFVLSLDELNSSITSALAYSLHLDEHVYEYSGAVLTFGQFTQRYVFLPPFGIGRAQIGDTRTAVTDNPIAEGADGVIALDALANFDVELNLKAGTVKLFSPDHCPGNVVYWGRPYVVVPIHQGENEVPYVTASLAGSRIRLGLEPSLSSTQVEPNFAHDLVDKGAAHLDGNIYSIADVLLQGVQFYNLRARAFTARARPTCYGGLVTEGYGEPGSMICHGHVDLKLGRRELRNMRLYYAFKEKKLYITAADPDPSPSAQHASAAALGNVAH